jgi:broad specificity phosphatase PhoE
LREKEFGILDGLTTLGVANVFPEQAEFRRLLGKFYHRPPGGESWCDVILRLRSVLDTISLHYAGKRVMIFTHQVVVLCMRYILETLDEAQILDIDRQGDVANCAITEYRFDPSEGHDGLLVLERYNVTAPMERDATPVTSAPDAIAGRRG